MVSNLDFQAPNPPSPPQQPLQPQLTPQQVEALGRAIAPATDSARLIAGLQAAAAKDAYDAAIEEGLAGMLRKGVSPYAVARAVQHGEAIAAQRLDERHKQLMGVAIEVPLFTAPPALTLQALGYGPEAWLWVCPALLISLIRRLW